MCLNARYLRDKYQSSLIFCTRADALVAKYRGIYIISLSTKDGTRSLIAVRFYRSLSGRQAGGQIHIVTVTDKNAVSESSCGGGGVAQ